MLSAKTSSPAKIELDSKGVLPETSIVLSPLKYFGNRGHKQEDIFYLIDLHRGSKKYECCYDLFAGSGSMTLAALSFDIADAYVMNDLYPPLQIFWQQVKSSPKALIVGYSDLLKKYLHSKNPSAFYARCQAHFNAITKNQKPVQDMTHYAVLFAFLINHAEHGMPFLSVDLTLQCQRSVQLPDLWAGQKEFKEAVLEVSHLFNKHNVSFASHDFSKMAMMTHKDVVLLDPPYPDMEDAEEKPEHHIYQRSVAKHPLSEQLKDYIEKLEKKGTPFLMFYGVLGMQNTCPIVYPQGHVLRLSGSATGPFQYYVEHLYVSPLLAYYIPQAQSQFPDRIQPCFPRLFETHAQCGNYKNGKEIALAWGATSVETRTYAEINASANVLANYLQRRLGKKSEALIAVYLERGPALFVTLMGIMKAGAAFLPLEGDDTKRLSISASYKCIQQSGADGLIVSSALWDELKKLTLDEEEVSIDWSKLIVIDLDQVTRDELVFTPEKLQAKWTAIPDEKSCSLPIIQPTDLAYVMYTSGSTGTPKGVEILHRGLPYAFTSHQDLLNLGPYDRVLQFASIGFDASLMEMMMAWGAGGSLYLANKTQFEDPRALSQFMNVNQITVAIQTPKMLDTLKSEEFPDLRSVLIVGDKFEKELSDRWLYRKTPDGNLKRNVVNGYGLTETTICTSLELCDEKKALTIGKPILGLEVYLRQLEAEEKELDLAPEQWIKQGSLDEKKEQELGALYVSGPCVANGYWKRPHLTEQRFKLFSFNGTKRVLYKTGDICSYASDGRLIYKWRMDRQVKIGGQRVELEQVERQILKYVKEAEEVRVLAPDEKKPALVAYLVPKTDHQDLVIKDQEPSAKSLDSLKNILERLRSNMPRFMYPALSHMKWVESLPTKENDKNSYDDKKMASWPVPCLKLGKKEEDAKFEATLSMQEKDLLHWLRVIWIKILNLPEDLVSYSVTFNEYGGDSIKTKLFIGQMDDKIKKGEQPEWEGVLKKLPANYLLSASLSGLVEKLVANNKQDIQDIKAFNQMLSASLLPLNEKLFSAITGISDDKIITTLKGSPKYIFFESMDKHKQMLMKIKGLPVYVIHSLLGDAELDYQDSVLVRETKVNYTFLNTPSLEEEKNHGFFSSCWIDKLIDYHLTQVKKRYDQGPYWFIGWSSGGWIAKLIASRLREKGEQVFVFLLDTECPVLLRDKGTADPYSCLTAVGKKINDSISLCMGEGFPKLSFVPDFSLGVDPVTLSRQFFENALKEFSTHCKSFCAKHSANLDRAEKIIRSAQKIYEAELQYKGPMALDQDDFLIVAATKEEKTPSTQNKLGWKVKENNIAYVGATHFDLLDKIQTCEIIEKKLLQQFKALHMPYFSALAYTLQNENQKAIKAWDEAIILDAKNTEAYFLRAQCKLEMKDCRGIVEDATHIITKLNHDQIRAYILRGEANWLLKNYHAVMEDANEVIARDSSNAYAYFLRGKARLSLGDHNGAITDATEAIRLNPKEINAYILRGNAQDRGGRYQEVIDDITKATELDFRKGAVNSNLYLLRAKAKLYLNDPQGAIKDATQAIVQDAQNSNAYFVLGYLKFILKDYQGALEGMNQAIYLDGKNERAYSLRGEIHCELKNYQAAIDDITRLIELNANDLEAYLLRGKIKNNTGDYIGAINDMGEVIKRGGNNAEAYWVCGVTKMNLGDQENALKAFNKAINLDNKNIDAYALIARIKFVFKNDYRGAIDEINKCIMLDKTNLNAYLFRAQAKWNLQDYDGVIEDTTYVIEQNAKHSYAYMLRGRTKGLARGIHYKDVMEDLNKAIEFDKRNADAYLYRALFKALHTEDRQAAISDAVMAVHLNPKNEEAQLVLAILIQDKFSLDSKVTLVTLKQHPLGHLGARKAKSTKKIGIFYDKFTEVEKKEFKETHSQAFDLIDKLYSNASPEYKKAEAKIKKMQLKDLAQLKTWVDAMREELLAKDGQTLVVKTRHR